MWAIWIQPSWMASRMGQLASPRLGRRRIRAPMLFVQGSGPLLINQTVVLTSSCPPPCSSEYSPRTSNVPFLKQKQWCPTWTLFLLLFVRLIMKPKLWGSVSIFLFLHTPSRISLLIGHNFMNVLSFQWQSKASFSLGFHCHCPRSHQECESRAMAVVGWLVLTSELYYYFFICYNILENYI